MKMNYFYYQIKIRIVHILTILLFLFFFAAATEGVNMETDSKVVPTLNDIQQKKWDALAEQKIFFGHQSVGYNIITGMQLILKENPQIKLNIVKMTEIKDIEQALFCHEWIGQNFKPASKLAAFSTMLDNKLGGNLDIAFMKFCYVDITSGTNIDTLFADYKQTLADLKAQYPNTTFIHVTVPLTAKPQGFTAIKDFSKNLIKKVLRKPVFDYKDNIKRNMFNAKMKLEYEGKEPLFDLAGLEAACSGNKTSSFTSNENTFLTLANECTYDGGHLNEAGARLIGEQLLIFLAQLPR